MKFKSLFVISLSLTLLLGFSSCSQNKDNDTAGNKTNQISIDKEKKQVTIPTEVNAKYFTEGTRHGVVFKDGSNGEKSILRGLVSEEEFYNALIEIGAKAGNNLTMDDMKKSASENIVVKGDKLDVFVTWEGNDREIPFSDIVKSTDKRPMDIRFGGNLDNAKSKKTGCILCLDSCAVGITSDAAYPVGTTQEKVADFNGKEDVLPKDGTKVDVIFRLAE